MIGTNRAFGDEIMGRDSHSLTIVLLAVVTVLVQPGWCDEEHLPQCQIEQIRHCLLEFNYPSFEVISNSFETFVFELHAQTDLNQLCLKEATFDMCMEVLDNSCDTEATLNLHLDIKDTINGLDKMCDTESNWAQHADCLDSQLSARITVRNECLDNNNIRGVGVRSKAVSDVPLPSNQTRDFCEVYVAHGICIRDSIAPLCGSETAEFMLDIYEAGFDETAERDHCDSSLLKHLKNYWWVLVIALVLLIISIAGCVVCVCRCKANKRREDYKKNNQTV